MIEDERGQVEAILVGRVSGAVRVAQPGRQPGRPHPTGVRPRGVQDGAAGPVDGAGVGPVEDPQVVRIELGGRPDMGQALPAAAESEDVVARLGRSIDDALDDGVEAGDVTAAGQDGDPFGDSCGVMLPLPRHRRWLRTGVGVESVGSGPSASIEP